jgi:hypothetical protein
LLIIFACPPSYYLKYQKLNLMTPAEIEGYIEKKKKKNVPVNIHFKDRDTITGIFIDSRDYDELKVKNFWRIVNNSHLEEWQRTKDENLSRVFNGASFTKLSEA